MPGSVCVGGVDLSSLQVSCYSGFNNKLFYSFVIIILLVVMLY